MVRKIKVKVRGYYKPSIGKRVKGFTYYRRDVGAPGRGRKVIPPLEAGELIKHGYRISAPKSVRHRALAASVKEDGYRTTVGRLIALQVFFKRTKPKYSRIAARDREWLVKTYGGEW